MRNDYITQLRRIQRTSYLFNYMLTILHNLCIIICVGYTK